MGTRYTSAGIEFVTCGDPTDDPGTKIAPEDGALAAEIASSFNSCNNVEMDEQTDPEDTGENPKNTAGNEDAGNKAVGNGESDTEENSVNSTGNDDAGNKNIGNGVTDPDYTVHDDAGNEGDGTDNTGNNDDAGNDPRLRKLQKKVAKLKDKNKKLTSQVKKLGEEKAESEDLVIGLMKKIKKIKHNKNAENQEFSEDPEIKISKEELKHINTISPTDSIFAGNLAIRLIGAEKLRQLSVTGKACPRFSKLKNDDGSLKHPARDRIDPQIFIFICVKVGERAAIEIGPDNLATIIKRSMEKKIREYLASKINNLRTAQSRRDTH